MDTKINARDVLKQLSTFDSLFYELTKNLVCKYVRKNYANILSITSEEKYPRDPQAGNATADFSGYKLHFKDKTSFAYAMEILSQIASDFSVVYDAAKIMHENYYQGHEDPAFFKLLCNEKYGFSPDEIQELHDAIIQLPPTNRQLKKWLNEMQENLLSNLAISGLRGRIAKDEWRKTRNIEVKDSTNARRNVMAYLMRERGKEEGWPEFTIPEKLSGGYSFDYHFGENGQLLVDNIWMAFRFSPKNIYEDITGLRLVRNNFPKPS